LSFFFVAVLLVIVGTYLIFIAGSIVFLKMLRKNKKYYYRTNHFISVSGMLYRMKQNAASLASICILSTMVLVTVSGTMTLYTGAQECIDRMYPREVNLYVSQNVTEEERENLKEIKADYMEFMQSSIEEQQLIPADETALAYFTVAATWTGAGFEYMEVNNVTSGNSLGDNYEVVVMDAENYEGLTGEAVELEPNQVLVWKMNEAFDYDSFTYAGHLFQVAEVKKELANDAIVWDGNSNMICIVVDSEETYIQLYQEQADKYGEQASGEIFYYGVNVDEEKSSQLKSDFLEKYSDYWDSHDRDSQASINTWLLVKVRSTAASDLMSSYSGIFFVGIFLGLVFLATTIVIMYYKQLSEGYQDRRRFQIMEKVGLTKREVKKSIRSQVLTVFFMPLLMAGLHTAFAFPMLSKGLRLFNMTNTKLFALCTLSCFGVFALVYVVIYTITSRTYYRIVSQS
jgi:putative ABC transport system permease protein